MQRINDINLEFRTAAAEGNLVRCKELSRSNRFDINSEGTPSKKTALHQAAIYNRLEVMQYLLSFGNIEHKEDLLHKTPFDYARENDSKDVMPLLAKKFPKLVPSIPTSDLSNVYGPALMPLIQNARSMTVEQATQLSNKIPPGSFYMGMPLLLLIALNSHNWNVMGHLINLGHSPNIQAQECQIACYRDTPLHMFLANEDPTAIQFVDLVIQSGSKIDYAVRDEQGKTPLLLAAKTRKPHYVKALLERGADVSISIPDNSANNILHVACILGDAETFNLIKNYPAFDTLWAQPNSAGKLPSELLNLNENETRAFIKSIFINPDRDLNAPKNGSKPHEFSSANTTFLKACLEGRKNIEYSLQNRNTFRR